MSKYLKLPQFLLDELNNNLIPLGTEIDTY